MTNGKCICTLLRLRELEVINVCNGRRLGCIEDIEFDLVLGNITAILLPCKGRLLALFHKDAKNRIRIPWCNIERIGEDTILVRYEEI